MDLAGKNVVIVGLGRSGAAAARLCALRGARVVATDDLPEERLAPSVQRLAGLPGTGVRLELHGVRPATLRGADLIVLSPGVPPMLPALVSAREAGVPVTGELELAARFVRAPIVGITGTNGKSTVTSLCGAIAQKTGRPSFCGGNLGTPLSDAVDTPAAGPDGIVVCEMSSFQLETAEALRCHAAAVLNLTPDHLDRYPSLAAYGDAKARIFRNMLLDATRVVNADDPEVLALVERNLPPSPRASSILPAGGEDGAEGAGGVGLYLFSVERPLRPGERGGFVDGPDLVLRGLGPDERYPVAELQIIGRHNQANALAAFLLMRASGLATYEQVRAAAAAFRPLPHRMELVGEHAGVRYYDDSKGTNVDAVVAGLAGFPRPYALIAGGRDKGGSYAPLARVLGAGPARGVVVIGEAAPLIEAAVRDVTRVVRAGTMEDAVQKATALCQPGDAVVLSPACSSFDMFRDYAHRAQVFCAAVRALAETPPPEARHG